MIRPIRTLLVANRGEIAIRVMRAATELRMRTVAIYSQEDRFSLHRTKADEAYLVGEGKGPIEAYLDIEDIIRIAREVHADAIHPGYGFLSENPAFAEACAAAGVVFIGPSPDTMRRLGNKVLARQLAEAAGVPVMPASPPLPRDDAECARLAAEVGYPVMLKASWGGGGRGMRVVDSESQLAGLVAAARREAQAAFGNDEVYLEKLIRRARHIEVQILGDSHGGLVHLWERDCTVQRRNQKVVERAPAVFLDAAQRSALAAMAIDIGRAADYVNAGTVEFLQDCGHRTDLLHRGESTDPGRAYGHRGGDRRGPGEGADPHCAGRAHRRPGQRRAGPGGDPQQRPRDAVPRDDRGPRKRLHSRLWPDQRLSQPGRLRRAARRRHRLQRRVHHAVLRLAAGQGHDLGADGGGVRRAHAPRPVGIQGPRAHDQPAVPRPGRHASGLRRRQLHDQVHRPDSGAVPVAAPAGPGDTTARLHRRRDRKRQPGSAGSGAGPDGFPSRGCPGSRCRRRRRAAARSWRSAAPGAWPTGC